MRRKRREPNRKNLTPIVIRAAVLRAKREGRANITWDVGERGLALRVAPSGHLSYKYVYSRHGRTRWFTIGPATLAAARLKAGKLKVEVREGGDPQAEKTAQRGAGTFKELADHYLAHAKKRNRSWPQARALVERHLLPRWGKLKAADIRRGDVKHLMASIEAPVVANQTLAAASAIFTWAIREEYGGVRENPCRLVERNATRSRERVLSDGEIPLFWAAFEKAGVAGAALKLILLVGQRPGEVACMRAEHIKENWWEMPGAPDEKIGWPGTKNGQTHRIWLPAPAQEIIASLFPDATGFVLPGKRGGPVGGLDAAMRDICRALGAERATPHDLRRTHGTTVAAMGFGRDLMNRIQNHREGGIASVYDRHEYAAEIKNAIEQVAARVVATATGAAGAPSNVVQLTSLKA